MDTTALEEWTIGPDSLIAASKGHFVTDRRHCRGAASQFMTTVIGAEFSSSALRLTRTR
jgi:hypothetical protein